MFSSYIKLAFRNMAKHRLYAAINIIGLAMGLAVFLFGNLLATYERDHDYMFSQRDRIFTAGSIFGPNADIGVGETDSIYTSMRPLMEIEMDQLEATARTVHREYLVSLAQDSFYQVVSFADPSLTRIFDFTYLAGDAQALEDPRGVVLTASLADKLFGRVNVVGETLTLDRKHDYRVSAVIEDLPIDSHFRSNMLGDDVEMLMPLSALDTMEDYDADTDWGNLSMGNLTYILLPPDRDQQWLQDQLNALYQRHAPQDQLEFIPALRVRPLVESNTMIWEAIGIPAIDSIRLLGLMVLIIACVNYTNLATAQSFGRAREVGLRKTFGADQRQLLIQFLTESLTTAALAMLLAVAAVELIIPLFNEWSDKSLHLEYLQIAPFLLLTTLAVGLLAGAYPALLITRSSPIDSLNSTLTQGSFGGLFRSLMIGIQFALSIFMVAMVLVVFMQNRMVEKSSHIFPKSQIVLLERVDVDEIRQRHSTLRQQLLTLPAVESVTYSSQVPFEQSNSARQVSRIKGDEASALILNTVSIDEGFLETYDIPLLNGRSVSRDIDNDVRSEDSLQVNVLLNQLAVRSLGFADAVDALGQSYFTLPREEDEEQEPVQYTIVGTVPDQNFLGLHNKIKPMAFYIQPDIMRTASIRIRGADVSGTLAEIEAVWDQVNPDYPVQHSFLDDVFAQVYIIFRLINSVLAGFALVALSLALIGLFGLAAFMAQRRTREIGIRKVLGAKVSQIVRLLIWQFSLPVLWSLLLAMPLTYLVSGIYLDFFHERITLVPLMILVASAMGVVTAWLIVAVHAIRIASASPIKSLRYE
jgi:putative ABC transport system permease protein